jgi:hypothetical protein
MGPTQVRNVENDPKRMRRLRILRLAGINLPQFKSGRSMRLTPEFVRRDIMTNEQKAAFDRFPRCST